MVLKTNVSNLVYLRFVTLKNRTMYEEIYPKEFIDEHIESAVVSSYFVK